MKSLFYGILLIIIIGVGGLVYRNAVEHPSQPIACPVASRACPDGTFVAHTGLSCDFPACPPPNVSFVDAGIAFAVPSGFVEATTSDPALITTYHLTPVSSTSASVLQIRRYAIDASSTPISIIHQTAINGASGEPVGITAFSSAVLGDRQFTVVTVQRFEGVIDTAYYISRSKDILRFDAIDSGVLNWTNQNLNVSTLPAHAALLQLLKNLQVL